MAGKRKNTEAVEPTKRERKEANLDPITNEPGAHPVGTGVGAALGGAATGAAIGAIGAGPIGVAAGAIAGAVIGGMAGHEVAEQIDPTIEHAYWRANFREKTYVDDDADYERYAPAYQYGWESYGKYCRTPDGKVRAFDDVEEKLQSDWERDNASEDLSWDQAEAPARDAWDRVHRNAEGFSDKPKSK